MVLVGEFCSDAVVRLMMHAQVHHYVIGYIIGLVALPLHILALPPVWGYLQDDAKKGLLTCCCRKSGPSEQSQQQ